MADLSNLPEYDKQKKLCRDCGKEIRFFKNNYTGKMMPVDAKPIKIVVVDELNLGEVKSGYLPHWETCENKKKD
jgi:hypothetical protein